MGETIALSSIPDCKGIVPFNPLLYVPCAGHPGGSLRGESRLGPGGRPWVKFIGLEEVAVLGNPRGRKVTQGSCGEGNAPSSGTRLSAYQPALRAGVSCRLTPAV
jgi:hypothetical protein